MLMDLKLPHRVLNICTGDMGAGHTVTALYEIVPIGVKIDLPGVDPLKGSVAAVSVGIVRGEPRLDLHYDDDVKAVVLRVDSPGGSAAPQAPHCIASCRAGSW